MKRTFVVATAVFLVATLNSCDTADTVTPTEVSGSSALSKAKCGGDIVLSGNIPLGVIEINPLASDQFAFINGKATYGVAPSPILMRDMVSVSLDLNAELHPLDGTDQIWLFSGKTTDQVALSNAGPTFLQKEYQARGLAITLYVRYEISACKVTVEEMWAVRDGRSTALPTDS
jgi:hypothetical protein